MRFGLFAIDFGVPFDRRGAIMDESLDVIRALRTEAPPRFHGRFAAFADVCLEPKPGPRRHPPTVIGGTAAPALARAARVSDGWYGFGLVEAAAAAGVHRLIVCPLVPAERLEATMREIGEAFAGRE
jgi:alkanesulfonate monooxygenase SsuD/methylene tetrahydromethanopterin reductase-like flavin-dependent oxidoreductase (luciferase family)